MPWRRLTLKADGNDKTHTTTETRQSMAGNDLMFYDFDPASSQQTKLRDNEQHLKKGLGKNGGKFKDH